MLKKDRHLAPSVPYKEQEQYTLLQDVTSNVKRVLWWRQKAVMAEAVIHQDGDEILAAHSLQAQHLDTWRVPFHENRIGTAQVP